MPSSIVETAKTACTNRELTANGVELKSVRTILAVRSSLIRGGSGRFANWYHTFGPFVVPGSVREMLALRWISSGAHRIRVVPGFVPRHGLSPRGKAS
jgi:hypothetical protein